MLTSTLVKYIAPPIIGVGLLFWLYSTGYNNGVEAVEAERSADRHKYELEVAQLNGQIQERSKVHADETAAIRAQLSTAEASYAARIEQLGSSYADRLRDSEQRAGRYRALADAGPTECRALASRAAELDTSLEQGRRVVEELRSTLEQRDAQLRLLGSQLVEDRKLLDNYGNDHF